MTLQSLTRPVTILRSQQGPVAVAALVAAIGGGALYSFSTKRPELDVSANNNEEKSRQKTFGSGPVFTSIILRSVEKLNHDSSRFRFSLPSEDAISGLPLTSAILTLTRPNGQWFPVIRPYTPVSKSDEPGFVDLVIKRYPNGKASSHIHSLTPGDSLFILAALKAYPWKQNEFSHITMIAGGAGITPMVQLLRGIFSNPNEKTKVTLLHGINTDEDALFRAEFTALEKEFPDRFNMFYTVTNPSRDTTFHKGRVSKELIQEALAKFGGKTGKVFVCGPPAMETALTGEKRGVNGGVLGELGFMKDQVFKF